MPYFSVSQWRDDLYDLHLVRDCGQDYGLDFGGEMKPAERPLNARVREPQVRVDDSAWRLSARSEAMQAAWAPAVFTSEEETLP